MDQNPTPSSSVTTRLKELEFHVNDIREEMVDYSQAIKELATNMNKMALAMAAREADQEKLQNVLQKVEKLSDSFDRYKEAQITKELDSSKAWIKDTIKWVAGIIGALILFHLTSGVVTFK